MKPWLKILLALLPISTFAQTKKVNFYLIDERVLSVPVAAPDSLAKLLTSPYSTDLEKVRSIFRWISENISYRTKGFHNNAVNKLTEEVDDTGALKPLNERVSDLVLKRGTAVCDGYARLFKTLCDYAGIKSELIAGYANGGFGYKFRSNHKWNAVYIDSSWYLLDATWASGTMNYSGDLYYKNFDERYFLTPPQDFIRDHYPEDPQWALLPNTPIAREFRYSPFATSSYLKNKITAYRPASGIIEASVGDTLKFEIETDNLEKNMFIVDTVFADSAIISMPVWKSLTKQTVNGRKISCTYTVPSENIEWLNIVLNDDVIMRYKLNVRKSYAATN